MKGQFQCTCCNQGDVDPKIKGKIRMIERRLGVDIIVTSGFRCEAHNASLPNAVANSKHLEGKAVDFWIPGWPRHEAREYCEPHFDYVYDFTGEKSWALHGQLNE